VGRAVRCLPGDISRIPGLVNRLGNGSAPRTGGVIRLPRVRAPTTLSLVVLSLPGSPVAESPQPVRIKANDSRSAAIPVRNHLLLLA
jgi:hypothetical protein